VDGFTYEFYVLTVCRSLEESSEIGLNIGDYYGGRDRDRTGDPLLAKRNHVISANYCRVLLMQ